MDRQLGQFERDIALWNDFNIPTAELKETVERRIQELLELQSDDDPPPWDVKDVYPALLNTILKNRREAAGEWMKAVLTDAAAIATLSPQKCHQLFLNVSRNFNEFSEIPIRQGFQTNICWQSLVIKGFSE